MSQSLIPYRFTVMQCDAMQHSTWHHPLPPPAWHPDRSMSVAWGTPVGERAKTKVIVCTSIVAFDSWSGRALLAAAHAACESVQSPCTISQREIAI